MKKMKKMMSIILSIALVLSTITVPINHASAAEESTSTAEITETDVISEGYTPIYTMDDLVAINKNPSGNYILMNDIDLTEATAEGGCLDTGHGWTPLDEFSGVFDGNGKRIIGMRIDGSFQYAGLFSALDGATVKNLGMVDVNVNNTGLYSSTYTGAIAGFGSVSNIVRVYCTGVVKGASDGYYKDSYVGGICGGSGILNNCYSSVNVYKGTSGGYAICQYGIFYNCYNASKERSMYFCVASSSNTDYCYYLEGSNQSTSNATALTDYQMRCKDYFKGFDFENTWFIDPYSTVYPYPQLKSCPMHRVDGINIIEFPIKRTYNQGEELDMTNAKIEVVYEDDLKQQIIPTEDMITGYDKDKIGQQTICIEYGGAKTEFDVEVKEIPVKKVNITANETSVVKGQSIQLSASVEPDNASFKDIVWSVENKGGSAKVSEDGLVTGLSTGLCTVTATATNGVKESIDIYVKVPSVLLYLNKNKTSLYVGETETLTTTLSPLDTTDVITWTSRNTNIAEVSAEGEIKGNKAGTTLITATTESGITATCDVTVKQKMTECSVVGLYDQEYTGDKITPSFSVTDGNDVLEKGTDYTVVYTNNTNAGEATVEVIGMGLYEGTLKKTFNIINSNVSQKPVKLLSLSKDRLTLYKGESEQLTLSITPVDTTDKVIWSNSDDSVASMSDAKMMTAIKVGTTTVNVRADSGITATCVVTVKQKLDGFNIVGLYDKEYTGQEIRPTFKVTDGQDILTENVDYIVRYSNNIEVGTANVEVVGKGYYEGSLEKTFKITKPYIEPTMEPTPTAAPTATVEPTPTAEPTATAEPTMEPTPTLEPTQAPPAQPTSVPVQAVTPPTSQSGTGVVEVNDGVEKKETVIYISGVAAKKNSKLISGKISESGAKVRIKVGSKAYKYATVKGKTFKLKLSYRLRKKMKIVIVVTKENCKTIKKTYKVK